MAQATKQEPENRTSLETPPRVNRGLTRPDPTAVFDDLVVGMEQLFHDLGFGTGWLAPTPRGFFERRAFDWSPQTEVFERNNELVVRADLPGLTKKDIDVDINDNALTIRGQRKSEHEENKEGVYRSDRNYGSFYRSIRLPEGSDGEQARAKFDNGVLEITMPVVEQQRNGRKLEIA